MDAFEVDVSAAQRGKAEWECAVRGVRSCEGSVPTEQSLQTRSSRTAQQVPAQMWAVPERQTWVVPVQMRAARIYRGFSGVVEAMPEPSMP
jgi:hypothetical protein